jgi:hypothetical protein
VRYSERFCCVGVACCWAHNYTFYDIVHVCLRFFAVGGSVDGSDGGSDGGSNRVSFAGVRQAGG